ncbi:peptide chain release factor N(5)-glutamine methyltransferase [Maribacter algicola]|uniref:Peptide chain release factor N(5)-glutamine methyltransferase n=1 Tax=Meishania litoralis TaxID=3434685 RepID=A0ACC7LME4_9FLAO
MLLREIKNIFHRELNTIYPQGEVDSFFYLLIEHYLKLERFVLALRPDLIVSKEQEQPLFEALAQLKLHRPVQYIIGKTVFMDLELRVNENVLIPRPETEDLVRWIIEDCRIDRGRDLRILDIGTGSGCIAIALAKNLPGAKVVALDVSQKALELAKKNAEKNGIEIEFIKADILNFNVEFEIELDVVVSNPPYVRELDKKEMSENVLCHEPELALFVPDEDPLRFYTKIADFAKANLKGNGKLYLEINQYLAEDSQALLEAKNFQDIELRKDLFGNNRMLKASTSF